MRERGRSAGEREKVRERERYREGESGSERERENMRGGYHYGRISWCVFVFISLSLFAMLPFKYTFHLSKQSIGLEFISFHLQSYILYEGFLKFSMFGLKSVLIFNIKNFICFNGKYSE